MALRALLGPLQRSPIAGGELGRMRGVFAHHRDQSLPDLRLMMNNEQLHHCGAAVNGGGKRFNNRVGSARTACS